MVAAFGFGFSFWLHQGRIPRHTCRFYLLLAGAPKDEGDGLCGAPLLHPLDSTSSPRGNPLRRGILAAAVDRDFGFRYPVQIFNSHFDISFGCFVIGSVSFAFQSGCWAWDVRFSLLGEGLFVPAATWGWATIFRWITADREWVVNTVDEGEGNRILSFHLQYGTVCYHYKGNYIPQSLPVEGG